jgi:phosphomevalonate kinase
LCNDVTANVGGVLATMVPGAGGYDAISILYINHPTVRTSITNYLSNYTQQNVCALTVQGVSYNDGLRIETQFPV